MAIPVMSITRSNVHHGILSPATRRLLVVVQVRSDD
jgi:hypothetical protein